MHEIYQFWKELTTFRLRLLPPPVIVLTLLFLIFDSTTPFSLSNSFMSPFSISVFSLAVTLLCQRTQLSISFLMMLFLLLSTVWQPSLSVCSSLRSCFLSAFFLPNYLLSLLASSSSLSILHYCSLAHYALLLSYCCYRNLSYSLSLTLTLQRQTRSQFYVAIYCYINLIFFSFAAILYFISI